jgi:DnaA-homolog protein
VKQLVLDLIPTPLPSFDNFVRGRNAEALAALADSPMALSTAMPPNSPIGAGFGAYATKVTYLWGVSGSGKSHLVRSLLSDSQSRFLKPNELNDALGQFAHHAANYAANHADHNASHQRFVIDNVERLNDLEQIGLFNLINLVSQVGHDGAVVATGNAAPRDLAIRPELASRLGSGLVFQLQPLTEAERAEALHAHANARGFRLRDDVIAYLLRHARRDMASLMTFLDALDHYSLETGREITLPLLREMSQPSLV